MANEKQLIDANALMDEFNELANMDFIGLDVVDSIINTPTVDAVEVKHGRWIHVDDAEYRCNQCKNHVCFDELLDRSVPEYNYCPHCGAKMDAGIKGG